MACYFCQRNTQEIDFKDAEYLKRFISGLGKIRGKNKTGLCSRHQKMVAKAIKRARHLGFLALTRK